MEDSVSQRMYLVTTVFTLVAFSILDPVVARLHNPTLQAGGHISVSLLEHIVQTGIVIWETFIEVLDGEPHTTSVLQRLHVVKG